MVSGAITNSLYLESATFQDEIDTYKKADWVKGTQKLFVAEKSHVELVEGSLVVSSAAVNFRFNEYLQFRIPFRPTVTLTGRVLLERDPTTGLISSYREFWDQDLKTDMLRDVVQASIISHISSQLLLVERVYNIF